MSLSINLANTVSLAEPGSVLGAGASNPALSAASATPVSPGAASPVTVTAIDPQDHTRLDQYLKAFGAPLLMAGDASNIANALVPVMQSVIRERPDLANVQFDFASSHGAIVVTSNAMNDADKSWLQGKLNAAGTLVQAVQSFHDHAVAGYATWAEADGNPLSSSEAEAVSQHADGLTRFMDLFNSVGMAAQGILMSGGTYHTASGATLDLTQDPGSAAGFLRFMQGAQSMAEGTATLTSSSGKTMYGVMQQTNIFELNSQVMPHYFPSQGTRSIGLNEVA